MEKLLEKLDSYKILYCEDNKDLQMTFELILKKYTPKILLAPNGVEGLEIFQKERPHIVITDINMPVMNGIELVKEIRKIDARVPVVIATSHEKPEYLLTAIDEGVDKFLVKPIRRSVLLGTIVKIVKVLEDEKMADEYRKKLEAEKLLQNTQEIISQFAQVFMEPIVILQNKRIKYTNSAFTNMVGIEQSKLLLQGKLNIDDILEKREGFCNSFEKLLPQEAYKNKISTYLKGIRKIFQVVVSSTHFQGESTESMVYVLQDITIVEYQRLKLENYAARLHDSLIRLQYKTESQGDETEEFLDDDSFFEMEADDKRELTQHDKALLRKTHEHKMTATEFLKTLGYSLVEELDELKELEIEADDDLHFFTEHPSKEALYKIISRLDKYAQEIKNLHEFDELAKALFSTRDLLSTIEVVDDKTVELVHIFLVGIFDDLRKWRETIFEKAATEDIHYLDASLFSSCLQLELALTGVKAEDDVDTDEFEFF